MDQRDSKESDIKNESTNNSKKSSKISFPNNPEPENDGIDESEIDFTARVAPAPTEPQLTSKTVNRINKFVESRTSVETPPRLSNPDFSKLTIDQLMRSSIVKKPSNLSPRSATAANRSRIVGKMVRPELSYDHKEVNNDKNEKTDDFKDDFKERSQSAENLPMTVEMRRASNSSGYFPGFRHQKISYSCDFETENPSQTSMFNRDYSKANCGLESVGFV